jgi:transposase InsO family protein
MIDLPQEAIFRYNSRFSALANSWRDGKPRTAQEKSDILVLISEITEQFKLTQKSVLEFFNSILKAFQIEYKFISQTIWDWFKRFNQLGLDGLKSKKSRNKNAKKVSDKVLEAVLLSESEAKGINSIHFKYEKFIEVAEKLRLHLVDGKTLEESAKEMEISLGTADFLSREIIDNLEISITKHNIGYPAFSIAYKKYLENRPVYRQLFTKGLDKMKDLLPSQGKRKESPLTEKQKWYLGIVELDSTKLDVMTKTLEKDKNGTERWVEERKTVLTAVHRGTRRTVWKLADSENSFSAIGLLYEVIDQIGIPTALKLDNGKAWRSDLFKEVCENLGIKMIFSKPYSGEEKGLVERVHKTIMHSKEFGNISGFIGHSVAERQNIENSHTGKAGRESKRKTQIPIKHLKTVDQMNHILAHLIDKYNSTKEAKTYLRRPSMEKIFHLFGHSEKRTIGKEGISWKNSFFRSDESDLLVGRKVTVYENFMDQSELFVKHIDELDEVLEFKVGNAFLRDMSIEKARKLKREAEAPIRRAKKSAKELREIGIEIIDSTLLKEPLREAGKKAISKKDTEVNFGEVKGSNQTNSLSMLLNKIRGA